MASKTDAIAGDEQAHVFVPCSHGWPAALAEMPPFCIQAQPASPSPVPPRNRAWDMPCHCSIPSHTLL